MEAKSRLTARLIQVRDDLVRLLLSWPFLTSLFILIANDAYLKVEYPGFLTGKISDFAGVYIFSLLAIRIAGNKGLLAAICVAVGFIFWKSPASQELIDAINTYAPFPVGRVVDYWDLIALVTIPLAWRTTYRLSLQRAPVRGRTLLSIPVIIATALAVAGTSWIWPFGEYTIRNTDTENPVEYSAFVAAIEQVADDFQLQCENCGVTTEGIVYSNDDMFFRYSFDELSNGIRFEVRVTKMKGVLMRGPDYDLFDRFLRALKRELGSLSESMEFSQNISDPEFYY